MKLKFKGAILRVGNMRWIVRASALEELKGLCEAVERRIEEASKPFKNSANVTVVLVPGKSGRGFVVRRMNYGRWRHRLADFFRRSRARRGFFRGLRLEEAGIPTPRMLAVGDAGRLRWPAVAYTICDEVPGAQPLHAWVRDGGKDARAVTERLADVLARLHERGFVHRDLKSSNVLLDRELNPWLIDMDGVRYLGSVSLAQSARDLATLARVLQHAPARLRWSGARFLRRYCRQRGMENQFRELAGEVSDKLIVEG